MIGVTGHWEGLDGLGQDELEELRPKAEFTLRRALLHFANAIKITLTGERSGRAYRVSKTGALHIASAPGEPPAVLFGNLRSSIGHSEPVWDGITVSGEVGVGLGVPQDPTVDPEHSYALGLELGTMRVARRPYIEPTALREEPVIEAMLEAGL